MFSKILYISFCLISLGIQANAHAIIVPALGVKGNGARSDVQRPSSANPCGKTAVSALSSSTPATADAQGNVALTVTDFNAGADGSRNIAKVQVDPTGTGKNFVEAIMVKNGDPAPKSVGSDSVTVNLPAGTKCTGAGGLCLMQLTTTAGFGNCVAVKQAGAAGAASVNISQGDTTGATKAASPGKPEGDAAKSKVRDPAVKAAATKSGKNAKRAANPAGARAARVFLAAREELTKRSGAFSWIWA